jgi:hypothetical protein
LRQDVAITGEGYVVIYKCGRTACFRVPKGLDNKLRGRQVGGVIE